VTDTILYTSAGVPALFFGEPVMLSTCGFCVARVPGLPEPWRVRVSGRSGRWCVEVNGARDPLAHGRDRDGRIVESSGSIFHALRTAEAYFTDAGYTPELWVKGGAA